MLGRVAAFEFRFQLRNPVFWIAGLLFFLLVFASITVDNVQIGGRGPVHLNAPFAVALTTLTMGVFFMFVTTAFVAGAAVRDDETGFGPILRSTPVSRDALVFGRFAGAWAAAALAFLFVPLGLVAGSLAPWVDRDRIGPFLPGSYVFSYLVWALPTLLTTGAVLYAFATATRSMMAAYVGAVGLLVLFIAVRQVSARLNLETAGPWLDPFGLGAFADATRYMSTAEKNAGDPALTPVLLGSRALWVVVGLAALVAARWLGGEEGRPSRRRLRRQARAAALAQAPLDALAADATHAPATPRHDRRAALLQFGLRTRFEVGLVLRSPAFAVLLLLGLTNAVARLWLADGAIYGVALHPVTRLMVQGLRESFSLIPMIVAIYYAGELVWRDRERRVEEIVGSTPAPDWSFAFPKMTAVALVLLLLGFVGVLAAAAVQALKGGASADWGQYLGWYVAPQTVMAVQYAVLAVFLQTVAPHKFVGWMLMLGVLILTLVAGSLGWDSNLLLFGGTPDEPLSDLNGAGVAGVAGWWFRAYWTAVAAVLAVLSYGLWRRGEQTALRPRLARLPLRLGRPGLAALALGLGASAAVGGWCWWNTDVLNLHHSRPQDERRLADMERALGRYLDMPQPKITAVSLNVELHPRESRADTRGSYLVRNDTAAPLREIHLRTPRFLKVSALSVEGARPVRTLERFDYRIFAFDTPMAPGETRRVSFATRLEQRGFRNSDNQTSVVANGSFVFDRQLAPQIGVDRDAFLKDRNTRRRFGLKPLDLRPPRLEDDAATRFNALRHDADFTAADITVSTDADQTPIAPGYRVMDVTAGGRRTARFRSEAPVLPVLAIQSARYAERLESWRDVELSVFYDPRHAWNVDRMLATLKAGLDYDTAAFGPYQFRQVRIVEFPDYAQFAISLPNTIPYSEGIGFVWKAPPDPRRSDKIDMVTYVTAHELAHQWWAHQETPSDQQGAAAVTESLAQYTSLMLMERLYGRGQIGKFLGYERDRYLRGRGGDNRDELPLERVENQPYIHYAKGSLVMYRLKDVLGEDVVNRALRRFLEAHRFNGPPFARSTDLVRILREEAGPDPVRQQLITDLWERMTLYDLKASDAHSTRLPDGRWRTTVKVTARKLDADGAGREREVAMNEPVEMRASVDKPSHQVAGGPTASIRTLLRSGATTLTLETPFRPGFVTVDPLATLIDRNQADNTAAVTPGR